MLENLPALLEILQIAFVDSDPYGTATRELRKLRKTNNKFSTYVADFMRLLAIVPWDERAKLEYLRVGLSQELQQGLVFLEDATPVTGLITQVTRLDTRQRSLQANFCTTQPWRTTTPQPPRPSPMPATPFHPAAYRPAPATIPSHPSFTAGGAVAMDVSGACCNDSCSGALVDQGVYGGLSDRVIDRVNAT